MDGAEGLDGVYVLAATRLGRLDILVSLFDSHSRLTQPPAVPT